MTVSPEDIRSLIKDKYAGDASADIADDIRRLESGEPLAYVIGWIPFLGCRISLGSRPLIPRVETEYWCEKLITRLRERFGERPFTFLDLCAGSGAIGVAVARALPNAHVSFAELDAAHAADIRTNLADSGVSGEVYVEDLFAGTEGMRFDVIATNPPYVPSGRTLDQSVSEYEPHAALYSGTDGLDLIRRIASDAPQHITEGGELWLECDMTHAKEACSLIVSGGAERATINEDQYGRPRYVVSYYP